MMLTGDGHFGVEKNRRGLGKTPFGGRIALNVSPTFRPAAQSVPRREFCFRSCIRKAYELNQFPTARSAARRWFYADPQSRAQIGIHFGDATDSLIAKVHYRSIRMESQITRMDTTGIGCAQKNTDRQIHDRVCLSVLLSERAAPLARIRRAARRLAGDSLSQLSTCPGAYYISGCNVAAMFKPRPREQGTPSESREFVTEQARGNTTQTAKRDNVQETPGVETGGAGQSASVSRDARSRRARESGKGVDIMGRTVTRHANDTPPVPDDSEATDRRRGRRARVSHIWADSASFPPSSV